MRIRPLSFFIVPFGTVLALLLALALVLSIILPSKAKAGEPDMNRVCRVMAEMTAKACWVAADGPTLTGGAKDFFYATCNSAGDQAKRMCLNEKTRETYAKRPTCDGLATFTRDSIIAGGTYVANELEPTPADRKTIMGLVNTVANRAGQGLFNACTEHESKQKEAPKPPAQKPSKPLPGTEFDV